MIPLTRFRDSEPGSAAQRTFDDVVVQHECPPENGNPAPERGRLAPSFHDCIRGRGCGCSDKRRGNCDCNHKLFEKQQAIAVAMFQTDRAEPPANFVVLSPVEEFAWSQ